MAENLTSKIEKPWTVYSWGNGTSGIARIVKEYVNGLDLKYFDSDKDRNPWDLPAVKRFKTPEEAISYHFKNNFSDITLEEIKRTFCRDFSKTLKQESIQNLHDTLIAYQRELSLPKCTRMSEQEKIDYALAQSNIC